MTRHHNMDFFNGGFSSDVPRHYGDRYYAQDAVRDFWYGMDVSGLVMKDLQGNEGKIIIRGGLVTQNTTNKVDITEFVGYAPFSVDTMNSFAATPPTVTQEDVRYVRVYSAALTALNLSTLPIPPTWGSTNYLKIAYAEADGATRAKAKATGSYAFERTPSYVITCDTTAATAYEIVLATLTSADAGVTILIDRENCTRLRYDWESLTTSYGGSGIADSTVFNFLIPFVAPAGSFVKASGIINVSGSDRPIKGIWHSSAGVILIVYISATYTVPGVTITKGGASTNSFNIVLQ
jgi:hypothetical protein